MKRVVLLLLAITLLMSSMLVGCQSKDVDAKAINKAITHIEAGELQNALNACQSMNKDTLEEGTGKILKCIINELSYYRDYDNDYYEIQIS